MKNNIFSDLRYSERNIKNSIIALKEMEKYTLANSPQELALERAVSILQRVYDNYYEFF